MSPVQPGRPRGGGRPRPLPEGVEEAPGGEFFYRPNRILLTEVGQEPAMQRSRDFLLRRGARAAGQPTAGVQVWQIDGDVLRWIDEAERSLGPTTGMEPDYIFLGTQTIKGGPWDDVHPATPPSPPWLDSKVLGDGFTVGVLDTGISMDPVHPRLDGRFTADKSRDQDLPNRGGGQTFLDHEGGHGTFVAGLVSKEAPAAHLAISRVLGPDGIGSVLDVITGISRVLAIAANRGSGKLDVLNLSLGGYSRLDRPPAALWAALAPLINAGTVVVAAAGNFGSARPFWPAAYPQVLAVGALDGAAPAEFTNFGPWVDACAPGVEVVSTFFDERDQEILGADLPPVDPAHRGPSIPATFPGFGRWSGTSFAAPKVAGAIVAAASVWGIPAREAANRLVYDWRLFRVPDLGVVVNVG